MIIDNIENYGKYIAVNSKFEKAFDFIERAVKEDYDIGKYEIEGDDIFASVQEYVTKNEEDCIFEGHRKYIDIQYIISGVEVIKVADISKINPQNEYDSQKDVQFFNDCEKAATTVIDEGEYGIFFPYDIHKPGMSFGGNNAALKKIVVKVKV